ncbi:hypothetical protein BKA69DRAFT_1054407 [Paraphysoderma sedebokerense]|nr:hypothetical protein BKA69DRAFT_1054407 [Paraphysoderma sedebokerense]
MSNNQLHPLLHGGVKVADLSVVSASNFLILTIEGDLYHFQNGSTFFVSPDTISASLTSTGSLYRVDRKYALWVFTAQSRQWRKIEEAGLVRSVTAAVDDTVWVLDEWNHLKFNINGEWKTHSGAMISYGVGIVQMTAAPDGTVLGTSYKSVLYKPNRDVFNENFAWDRFFDNMQFIHAASASHIIGVDGLGSIKTLSAGTFVPVPNDPKTAKKAYITVDGSIFVIDQQHHVCVLNQSLPFQTPITLPSPTQKSHVPLLLTPALNLQWYPLSTSQSFVHVSVASTSNIIAVTDSNKLVQFDPARDAWSLVSADAIYASVTTDGTIFKLDRSSKLHKFDGYAKTWEDQGKNFISITAKERTQAWALTNFGEMFALKNGEWKANEYVGKNWGRDIVLTSSGEDNTTVGITREGKLYYVENPNVVHGWVDFVGLFPSPIPKMQYVDVGSNGAVVAVDCDGSVYRITHEGIQKLTSVGGLRFTKVSVGIDGLVVGLTLNGKLYSYGAPISNNPEQAIAEPQYEKPPVSMQSMMPADSPYAVPVPSSFTPQVSIPPAREPAFPSTSPYGSIQSLQAPGYPLLTSTDPISHISLTNSQNVLVVTASGLLYQFVQSAWYLLSDDTLLAELAPENNGVIYRTDGCHNLFKYDPWQRQWMALGKKFRSFAIGQNNVIWGINDFEDVYVFENGNWKLQNDGATKKWGVGIMQISVGYDGTTLGVALKNKLCRHTGHGIRSWEGIGNAKSVAVGSSSQILTINGNDQLCKFGNTQSVPIPNLSVPVKSAKIGQDGTIVFIDNLDLC